ncbi:DJ-1/PfpI family protein [Aeromicrobium endophyticum]|uniref:DJ-1/PfpI family protein n=1 Tax=Aeromicrobium endophyticum TaxID=2292704 RepID=A0A371NZY8_9ACTN|nr:DJ-1/PfpI family protein [Aeromicrobium endophyticum]REK68910.1 DJ-1/PfpI family protein [Aeromicrobium endophyticum]
MTTPLRIGLLVFPDMTQLDMTGPLQVFSAVPDVEIHLLWKTLEPVRTDSVMRINPTTTIESCPQLDVICVPGGYGTDALLGDRDILDFLTRQGASARYITSVCTGALVLGAAGLLDGYEAVTHWTAMDVLGDLGAIPVQDRVVIDRNRVTGGGVTAGIDFALTLVAEIFDRATAEGVQLRLEYVPHPPFDAGSPHTAPPEVLAGYQARIGPAKRRRAEAVSRAAARLAAAASDQ